MVSKTVLSVKHTTEKKLIKLENLTIERVSTFSRLAHSIGEATIRLSMQLQI